MSSSDSESDEITEKPSVDSQQFKYPNMRCAHLHAMLKIGRQGDRIARAQAADRMGDWEKELFDLLKKDHMAELYQQVCTLLGWKKDDDLLSDMKNETQEIVQKLGKAKKDAEEGLSESDVRELSMQLAVHYLRIMDRENAEKELNTVYEKSVTDQKLDILFSLMRVGFFVGDVESVLKNLEKMKILFEEGSSVDWERKNRFKIYAALASLQKRDFSIAAKNLIETISTFSADELVPLDDFLTYAVLLGLFSLDRDELKEKIIDSPEVLQIIAEHQELEALLNSFYACDYRSFYVALAGISDQLKFDFFMNKHAAFYNKELRLKGYTQYLETYKSVSMKAMADAFGVGVDFIEEELTRFISSGRLHCKIDGIEGLISNWRLEVQNFEYQEIIEQGDELLNKMQKLSRFVSL